MYNFFLKTILFFFLLLISFFSYPEKISNVIKIEGVYNTQLIGYGIIVGLDGTGDELQKTPFTVQAMKNMLSKLGMGIFDSINKNIDCKNIASVIVTAEIPNLTYKGQKINILVSSIGNAKSIIGGVLLMTPLKGINNEIYAVAQGRVTFINKKYSNSLNNKKRNFFQPPQLNNGRIYNGAIITKSLIPKNLRKKTINLYIIKNNMNLAKKISNLINDIYPKFSIVINSRIIQIKILKNNVFQTKKLYSIQNIEIPEIA